MFNRLSSFVNKHKVVINIAVFIVLLCCFIFPICPLNEIYSNLISISNLASKKNISFCEHLILDGTISYAEYQYSQDPLALTNANIYFLSLCMCLISFVLSLLNVVLSIKGNKNTNIFPVSLFLIALLLLNDMERLFSFQFSSNSNWIVILVLLCLMSIYYILWGIDKFKHRPTKPKKPTQAERIEMLEKELTELKSKTN